jgi:hypothetical protein
LFFDPINQEQQIKLAESFNIVPLLCLNDIPARLQKKEDLYLFTESFRNYNCFTNFEEIKTFYKNINIELIDRPQIPVEKISKLLSKIKKYDIGLFCENKDLARAIQEHINESNPRMQVCTIQQHESLENMYDELSVYDSVIIMDNILLSKIAIELGINTISNRTIQGAHYCVTISSIIKALSVKNNDSTEKKLIQHNFDTMFKNYITNIRRQ